jgi:hypothetical protein
MMLKPLALGLLSMTAVSTGAALAGNQPNPNVYVQSWSQSVLINQPNNQSVFDNDWQDVVNDTQLPIQLRNLCASNPQQCDQWEDWAESIGIWNDPADGNPQPAPEVDPAGAMAALTMLGAVLVMLRGRRAAGKPV